MNNEDNTNLETKPNTRKWIVTSLMFVACVVGLFFKEEVLAQETVKETFSKLTNAFSLPALLFFALGALTKLGSLGAYDSLGFGFSKFGIRAFIPGQIKNPTESLYDYKVKKDEKGRKWLKEAFFIGLAGLVVSIILLVVYFLL